MAKTIKLDDDVRAILARSSITATTLTLPEQLTPADYKRVMKAISAAGGKWDRKAGHHVFTSDPREALGMAVSEGQIVNRKQALQAFYTPDALADRLAELLDPKPGDHVLEPSCGEGALVRAVLRRQPELFVSAFDIDRDALHRAWALDEDRRAPETTFRRVVYQSVDFLAMSAHAATYDGVIMNPPFAGDADIAHVRAAWTYLRPGGTLAAITSPGWLEESHRAVRRDFKAWLEELGAEVERIEAGAFAESGTQVASVMLRVRKPEGAGA